jgi:hypothetical protein
MGGYTKNKTINMLKIAHNDIKKNGKIRNFIAIFLDFLKIKYK